jgi:putative restriction endonuclease
MPGSDAQIQIAAFRAVYDLHARRGDSIPWSAIDEEFVIENERTHLSGKARGIFKPRQLWRGVLSVKTTMPRKVRERRYDDIASEDGFFEYRFMGNDPRSSDNRALRKAMEDRSPFIYFHAVEPSFYQAILLVFVTDWASRASSVIARPP